MFLQTLAFFKFSKKQLMAETYTSKIFKGLFRIIEKIGDQQTLAIIEQLNSDKYQLAKLSIIIKSETGVSLSDMKNTKINNDNKSIATLCFAQIAKEKYHYDNHEISKYLNKTDRTISRYINAFKYSNQNESKQFNEKLNIVYNTILNIIKEGNTNG